MDRRLRYFHLTFSLWSSTELTPLIPKWTATLQPSQKFLPSPSWLHFLPGLCCSFCDEDFYLSLPFKRPVSSILLHLWNFCTWFVLSEILPHCSTSFYGTLWIIKTLGFIDTCVRVSPTLNREINEGRCQASTIFIFSKAPSEVSYM